MGKLLLAFNQIFEYELGNFMCGWNVIAAYYVIVQVQSSDGQVSFFGGNIAGICLAILSFRNLWGDFKK